MIPSGNITDMKLRLATFLLFALATTTVAGQNYGSVVISEVTSVYDGDTFRANIPDYPQLIGKNIGIRINGIDTPEIKGKCEQEKQLALKAKQFIVKMLSNAKMVELRNLQRGKYFRIVADVYADEVNVGDELVKESLAVIYYGGKKVKNWCQSN